MRIEGATVNERLGRFIAYFLFAFTFILIVSYVIFYVLTFVWNPWSYPHPCANFQPPGPHTEPWPICTPVPTYNTVPSTSPSST
jgi:hypothetical protein